MFKDLKTKFFEKFEKIRKNKYFSFALIIFLVVILAFLFFYNKNEKSVENFGENLNYVETLEKKLESVLESIENVGKVSVAITVDGGVETIIAMKTITSETIDGKIIEEIPIMVNGKTVTLKEVNPNITGVVVVAEGGNDFTVIRKIQQATVSMLGVNIDKIEILTMK